jgi:hypothetical protein
VEAVEWLVEHGADVDAVDNKGRTALAFATQMGHDAVVAVLTIESLTKDIVKSEEGAVAATLALVDEKIEVTALVDVKKPWLQKALVSTNAKSGGALEKRSACILDIYSAAVAAREERESAEQEAVTDGAGAGSAKKNKKKSRKKKGKQKEEQQQQLQKEKEKQEQQDGVVVKEKEEKVINALGAIFAKSQEKVGSEDAMNALFVGILANDLTVMERAVEAGASVSTPFLGANGCTPLHAAAAKGYVEVLQWLLAQGADLNAVDIHGNTALHDAAATSKSATGNLEAVKCLVEAGADDTVLYCTVLYSHTALVHCTHTLC